MKLPGFLLACLVLAYTASSVAQETDVDLELLDQPIADEVIGSADTPLPLEQIKSFAEIFTRIKQEYVEEVTDEELLEYAVEGMLNGLDPHSSYLRGERLEALAEDTTGRFSGLGLEVMMDEGFVFVIAPIDDSPAAAAGIQTGDIIIRINGQTISGTSLQEATKDMRGAPGTEVTLTVLRETEPDPLEVTLRRAVVSINTVKRKRLSDEIGYLRITQFQVDTAASFRRQLKMLREKKEFAGLIVDLRNNPGGLLTSAVSIADVFLTHGDILSTRGRLPEDKQVFKASATDMIDGKPIVVLINGGSASASEIVAGALQDHQRALVLGTESFGKGSVQSVVNINDTEAIKLTTARYYTPGGRSIQAAGIVPDVVVKDRQFKQTDARIERIKERNLSGHLKSENKPVVNHNAEELNALLASDYQLNEAFNLLKGLVLYGRTAALDKSVGSEP